MSRVDRLHGAGKLAMPPKGSKVEDRKGKAARDDQKRAKIVQEAVMTVKRRPRGSGKAIPRGRDDALTLEEWKRRKSDDRAGTAARKRTATHHKADTGKSK
jgi:hypothetical protein